MAQPLTKTKAASPAPSTGRRGRPTADRAQAIGVAILAAAREIFLDVGFEAASMDAIAACAAVSKGTLYARYENKRQLFRAVIEEEIERISQAAGEKARHLPPEVEPRLRHYARSLTQIFEWPQFRALGRLIDSAVRAFPDLEGDWRELATGRYLRFLAKDIALAPDTRGVTLEDCDFLAELFLHSIAGWHHSQVGRAAAPPEKILAFADRVIDTIMLAIRAKQESSGGG